MSDFFGDFPNRPDIKEFWQLSEIVLRNDARATEGGYEAVIEEIVPVDVVSYMAEQRILRALQIMKLPKPPKEIFALFLAIFSDGFAAGGHYVKKYPKDSHA